MSQTQTQQQPKTNYQVLLELTALLGAGIGASIIIHEVMRLLSLLTPPIGIENARWLANLTAGGNQPGDVGVPPGPCQDIEKSHAPAWLAQYLIAAAVRLAEADEVAAGTAPTRESVQTLASARTKEEGYFQLHLKAEERRMRAAALQDMAAILNSDREAATKTELLGWRAVIDERTTLECAMANGSNFRADQMPLIGWPGAVHMKCRCSAGPAVPGAPLMPSV